MCVAQEFLDAAFVFPSSVFSFREGSTHKNTLIKIRLFTLPKTAWDGEICPDVPSNMFARR